ncbi:putative RNA binding protein [Leptomonas pyrrhocoris]|uniref:Putative RNA binding protein n=1 Tax=Leptomonas pyrrhocoris TaxID=157538 RepID=A0A0M9G1T1_LEPPY|nr:putative RNA binding protein [Leptomonas pyrrhocoris]KPA80493.1 putative RNA binding protein [Leptomonas pyrrhocoris]|eukprot:XP_015658932.1 putative RNA binding protein [Leptomonas pyrrhocoris]
MPSKPSPSEAPKPVGAADDLAARTTATPVLPPASPKKSAMTSALHGPATESKSTSTTSAPQHTGPTIDDALSLPTILPIPEQTECRSPHSYGQQQQRPNGVRRTFLVSENSPNNVMGNTALSSTSTSGRATADNFTAAATAAAVVRVSAQDGGFADGLVATNTTATTGSVDATHLPLSAPTPTLATKSRQTGKPPMMNPNLFAHDAPDAPSTPFNGRPSSSLTGGAAGLVVSAQVSAPMTPVEPSRTNLIVYNIGNNMTEDHLHELFDGYGSVVSCAVMREIHTGQSLGTAFVRFATHTEARRALTAFSDRTNQLFITESKPLVVQWARKQHDDTPIGEARKKIMKLFVRNIPLDCSVEALEALFGQFGCVRQVTLHKDTALVEDAALERLIAFVIYTEEGAAERAATAMHNTRPFPSCNGIPIMIKLAENGQRRRFYRNSDGTTTSVANSPMAGTSGAAMNSQTPTNSPAVFWGAGNEGNSSTNGFFGYGAQGPQVKYVPAPRSQLCDAAMPSAAYPSAYQVPSVEYVSTYAQPGGATGVLTTDDYGLCGPQSYVNSNSVPTTAATTPTHPNNRNWSCSSAAVDVASQRGTSCAQLSQRGGPCDYEDVGGVDSLIRVNAFPSGGCSGHGSSTYSLHQAANSFDASLTGFVTDRGSHSSKSTAISTAESGYDSGSGGGGAVRSVSAGWRGASAQSRRSANDGSANVSVHGSLPGSEQQLSTPGTRGSGSNSSHSRREYKTSTPLMSGVSSGNGLSQPQYSASGPSSNCYYNYMNYSNSIHNAPPARNGTTNVPPMSTTVPSATTGGIRSSNNSDPSGERGATVQYYFSPDTAPRSNGSGTAASSPSRSTGKRYYNNPYCAESPKLYC